MSRPIDHLGETDERPWEEPGSCRMDCEPHRAPLPLLLGSVTLAAAPFWGLGLPALLGLALGGATIAMAQRDLCRMEAGLMDPNGREKTDRAFGLAAWGVFLGISLLVPACGILRGLRR